ncbi:dopamine beta-hydroxylase-like [Littorina saxatilis]|uniref:Temptin n=1 Tax=Littorina saxatilis TaxID=31220 RepID=A0AAN9AWW2_9CAEN
MRMLLYLVSAIALWSVCHGYYNYQTKVPNGQHVPHPCKPNFIWHGVGHLNPLGGGERNPFGKDFARLGHEWSVDLCRLDSDGDGLTNGQELGDPTCVWREGEIPRQTDNITHPGVCDPWDSHACAAKNTWVSCDVGEFKCDAIHEQDVRNITLRFPRTKVPADETTYECFVFDFPSDEEYHLIATQPYIDNPNVMHHMVAFACDDSAKLMDAPAKCNMGALGCSTTIGIWTLGMTGECINPEAGFRVGKGGATRVAFQFHWTNKQHVDHWYDSSGMTLYYTPQLRPNDAGVLIIGQNHLDIPPGVSSLTTTGTCTSHCTQTYMNSSINVISVLNHMHYLGVHGNVEQIRDGHVIKNLSMDRPYSYDNPHMHRYETPLVVKPGDELKMICEFSSLGRDHTTVDGQGSYNEMCYGLITYYPKENLGKLGCIQWKDLDFCDFHDEEPCNIGQMFNSSNPETAHIIDEVLSKCGAYGSCRKECPPVIATLRQDNPCLRGTMWEYIKTRVMIYMEDGKLLKLVSAMDICDREGQQTAVSTTQATPTSADCKHNNPPERKPSSGTESKPNPVNTFLEIVHALGSRPLLQNIIFNNNNNNNGN